MAMIEEEHNMNKHYITAEEILKLPTKSQILFAIFCAEQVFHLVKEEHKPNCRVAIDKVKAFLEGTATKDECRADAYAAADAAAADAATADAYAAYAAYAAADAAAYAAADADAAAYAAINAQRRYYDDLLSFEDGRVDAILIEGT